MPRKCKSPTAVLALVASAFVPVLPARPAAAATPAYTTIILDRPAPFAHAYGIATAAGQHVGYAYGNATTTHALLWTGTAGAAVDLHPPGFTFTQAMGTDGARQVGYGGSVAAGRVHALLWTGTADSVVDLHPPGYTASFIYGMGSNQAVGYALDPSHFDRSQAIVWDLASGQATDLHPLSGFSLSRADGTDGTRQVGFGMLNDGSGLARALAWSGTAESATELPSPYLASGAKGVHGDQIVGSTGGYPALWVGPDHTFIPLGGPGIGGGVAYATNGTHQVGQFAGHAVRWSGSVESVLDLHQYLPAGFGAGSRAHAIDVGGNILGIADVLDGGTVAVLWVPVIPEPSVIPLMGLGAAFLLVRRHA